MSKQRMPVEEFISTLDLAECQAIYGAAIATLGEPPCDRHGYQKCDTPPEHHQTCPRCFSWRDCTDPECGHPACGSGPARRFSDAWRASHPESSGVDCLVSRGETVPLIEYGRMSVLVNEIAPDAKVGAKILDHLSKRLDWWQLYDMKLGVDATAWLPGEIWLLKQEVHVEASLTTYQVPVWIAYEAGRGLDPSQRKGGMGVFEFRLAEALALESAPLMTQGSLF